MCQKSKKIPVLGTTGLWVNGVHVSLANWGVFKDLLLFWRSLFLGKYLFPRPPERAAPPVSQAQRWPRAFAKEKTDGGEKKCHEPKRKERKRTKHVLSNFIRRSFWRNCWPIFLRKQRGRGQHPGDPGWEIWSALLTPTCHGSSEIFRRRIYGSWGIPERKLKPQGKNVQNL